jgi:hypothetical protein
MARPASGGTRAEGAGGQDLSLLDACLPRWDVRDRHEATVRADRERAWAALRALDLERPLLVRALFFLRTLPERLRGRVAPRRARPFLESALEAGWRILGEEEGRELVLGAVTKPWEPVVRFRGLSRDEFVAFEEPGWAKIAWSIEAFDAASTNAAGGSAGARARVAIETRVSTTDPESRRKFRRYWAIFSPGIRLIRVVALADLRRSLRESA